MPKLVSKGCNLIGCGSAMPTLQISNDDLLKIVDTSNEWISVQTGIQRRRVLSEAARKALEMAKVDTDDIDLILMCTLTPEDLFGNAPQIQKQLGCTTNLLSYDVPCIIITLQARNSGENGLFGFDLHSDGNGQRHLNANLTKNKSNNALDSNGSVSGFPPKLSSCSCIQMNGKEVFSYALPSVPQSIEYTLEKAGLPTSSIDWLLLHQANQRIIDAVATRLEVPSEWAISSYGNISATSIPLALDEAIRSGKHGYQNCVS